MKLVAESLQDILKPKDREEFAEEEKTAIENTEYAIEWIEEELEFINSARFDGRPAIDDSELDDRLSTAWNKITDIEYEIPDHLKERFSDDIARLFSKLENLLAGERIQESLNEQKKLNLTAGFVIIYKNKILLEHPTGAKWHGTYSIPKGRVEEGEDFLQAAKRETQEEIGFKVDPNDIVSGPHFIDYTDKKGKVYKRVYYYVVQLDKPPSKFKLQKEEVDWAGFLDKKEAKKRILWRLKEVLKYLK